MIRYKYDKVRASCVAKVCQELRTMDLVCAVPVVGTPYSGHSYRYVSEYIE